jgi:hypothetical protein
VHVELQRYGIVVHLGPPDPDRPGTFLGGTIESSLEHADPGLTAWSSTPPRDQYLAAVDALESLILAHAVAGVDVTSPAYLEGLDTAVDAISDNFG